MVLRHTLPRWPPLAPEFVVARGEVARTLARLLLADPARLAGLRGVVSFGELRPSLARERDATDLGRALDHAAPGEGELGRDLARGGGAHTRALFDHLARSGERDVTAADLTRGGALDHRAPSGERDVTAADLARGRGAHARGALDAGERAAPAADLTRGGGARGPGPLDHLASSDERGAERALEPQLILAVTGDDLPWLDGVEYFGRDGAASWLLVPTTRTGPVPTSWLERRYRAALPSLDWPCLLLDDVLLPVGRAAAFDRDRLSRWCSDG